VSVAEPIIEEVPHEEATAAPATRAKGRVLIFIVMYAAQRHIASVLTRIPPGLFDDPDVECLIIDDASPDESTKAADAWIAEHGRGRITLLRNPQNQGYGGNQKLGYRIAIERGFDFVILLHGDGQYAPELLPKFIERWRETDADVVLGTRMDRVKDARAGGMPWYKVVGNSLLTWFQNKLTRQKLAEWHTGYRGYATRFLKAVPFEVNTNEFHFDTEILLQATHVGARIEAFPIPTKYGDEVCHVDGTKYAWDVVKATVQFRLHQTGMMCSLKYRNLSIDRYRDKTQTLYSSHAAAIRETLKRQPKRVLDLGCGPGFVARQLENAGVAVTGVDAYDPQPGMMSRWVRADLEKFDELPVDAFDYDVLLMLDVIEHLAAPEDFLVSLRNRSRATEAVRKPPVMVLTTPNVAFFAVRMNLLTGRFNYAERGILDITHKRLFTKRSLKRALTESGYRVESIRPVAAPFEVVMKGSSLGKLLGQLAHLAAVVWPTMFAFQWLVVCRPLPGIRQLLMQSEKVRADAEVHRTLAGVGQG
jgi:glycosyltransferase involved in cell wall biosynthesis